MSSSGSLSAWVRKNAAKRVPVYARRLCEPRVGMTYFRKRRNTGYRAGRNVKHSTTFAFRSKASVARGCSRIVRRVDLRRMCLLAEFSAMQAFRAPWPSPQRSPFSASPLQVLHSADVSERKRRALHENWLRQVCCCLSTAEFLSGRVVSPTLWIYARTAWPRSTAGCGAIPLI